MQKHQLFSLALIASLFFSSFVSAHPEEVNKQNILQVTGSGQTPVTPDVGELVLGIEADSKSASEAQTKASAVLSGFIGQLKGIGINANEIKTVESSLNPVRDYNGKPPYRILSYTAVQKVRVRVNGENRLNLISRAIDVATQNSINRIESVQFSVSPERSREASRKALAMASDDALKTGKEVLGQLGLNLVRIKEINLNYISRPYPVPMPMMMRAKRAPGMADAEEAPEISNIMPGETMIEGTANLVLEFSGK